MTADVVLLAAGIGGGALNAMAGGGSFVTLPALVAMGVPSVTANATSTVALFPSGVANAWMYRGRLATIYGVPLRPAFLVTLAGGLLGAVLLLTTPSSVFDHILPWLLLLATIAMIFGARLGPMLRRVVVPGRAGVLAAQFVLGVYGGYFGGAVGLMMVALWSLLGDLDVAAMQGPRTLFVAAANLVAVVVFAVAHAVAWHEALLVGVGAILGGVTGAWTAKRMPAGVIRVVTIAITIATTAAFFGKSWGWTV